MSLGCARCGSCCEAIRIGFDPRDKPAQLANYDGGPWDPRTRDGMAYWLARHPEWAACPVAAFAHWQIMVNDTRFYAEHWHVLWSEDRPPADEPEPTRWRNVVHVVECDAYDPVHRSCTKHDERPMACRHYPWYDAGPWAGDKPRRRATGLQSCGQVAPGVGCSYLLDVPAEDREGLRPLIPLAVV